MKKYLLFLLILPLTISCQKKKGDAVVMEKKSVKIETYDKINNNSIYNIELTDEVAKNEMQVVGPKKALDNLTYEIANQTLIIKNKENVSNLEDEDRSTIRLNHSMLQRVELAGVGSLSSQLPQTNSTLELIVSGAGDVALEVMNEKTSVLISGVGNVKIKGKTIELLTKITGAGNLDALDLESEKSQNSITGIGNANVWSTKSIRTSITGIGNLTYKKATNVEVVSSIEGLGRVKQTK